VARDGGMWEVRHGDEGAIASSVIPHGGGGNRSESGYLLRRGADGRSSVPKDGMR
jgi:hypothetical protein